MDKLLAGPVLRRSDSRRVLVWTATAEPATVAGSVYRVQPRSTEMDRLGGGSAQSVQIGRSLWVHLAALVPDGDEFPSDTWLGYDIEVTGEDGAGKTLADFGLLSGRHSLTYEAFPLPSFFLRRATGGLALIHGSCRMLHGRGEDALPLADEQVARTAADMSVRPSALFLTGDQLYADDVAGPLVAHLHRVGEELVGEWMHGSLPGLPTLSEVPLYGRMELCDDIGFTSEKDFNHLLSFGEFAALYLMNWNEQNWPSEWAPVPSDEELPGVGPRRRASLRRKYIQQTGELDGARRDVRGVRRLLANVPSYMIFDDHDVTDDWNLSREWNRRVHASPGGRRVIANALAGYWAFQGWGNNPDAYDDSFKRTLSDHLVDGSAAAAGAFDKLLWKFDKWSFVAPTDPLTLFLDTRTQRGFDSERGAAKLISRHGLDVLADRLAESGFKRGDKLNVVSAVPVYGFEARQQNHKYLISLLGPYKIDLEAWRSNRCGFVEFLTFMTNEIAPERCVFLSGDVHYAFNVRAEFATKTNKLPILQFTSSPQKNTGNGVRAAIGVLGRVIPKEEEHLGWDTPPRMTSANPLHRLRMRAAMVSDDEPVFLTRELAHSMRIDEQHVYEEKRVYVTPSGPTSSLIVACNNVGYVLQRDDAIVHRLLTHARGRTTSFTAAMPVQDPH